MNLLSRRLRQMLFHSYEGQPWHGSNLLQLLNGIDTDTAFFRVSPSAHHICELVMHMAQWRHFVVEKMQGNAHFDIDLNTLADWPAAELAREQQWQQALAAFAHSQQQLLAALDTFTDEQLNAPVPGKNYKFHMMLHGIINHDIYHAGQIAFIKKAAKELRDA